MKTFFQLIGLKVTRDSECGFLRVSEKNLGVGRERMELERMSKAKRGRAVDAKVMPESFQQKQGKRQGQADDVGKGFEVPERLRHERKRSGFRFR